MGRRRFSQKMNEQICFVCSKSKKENLTNVFVCFLEESAFGFIWPLHIQSKGFDWSMARRQNWLIFWESIAPIIYMFSKLFHQKSKNLSKVFFQTMFLFYVITTSQTKTWPWTYVNSVQEMHTCNVAGKLNLLQMHEGNFLRFIES